ncbi:hypothetical protein D3C71_1531050 [compost metagenome]
MSRLAVTALSTAKGLRRAVFTVSSAARKASVAAFWEACAASSAGLPVSISASSSVSRVRWARRTAAGRGASARLTKPSQR